MKIPTNGDFVFPTGADVVGTPTICTICGAPVAFSWERPDLYYAARDAHINWHKELEQFIKNQVKEL